MHTAGATLFTKNPNPSIAIFHVDHILHEKWKWRSGRIPHISGSVGSESWLSIPVNVADRIRFPDADRIRTGVTEI
jgi:hypothetical protein